jgi:hypothetical protein
VISLNTFSSGAFFTDSVIWENPPALACRLAMVSKIAVNLITSKILDNRCRLATEKLQHGTGLEPVQSNFKCITLIGSLPVGKAIVPTVVINKQSSPICVLVIASLLNYILV